MHIYTYYVLIHEYKLYIRRLFARFVLRTLECAKFKKIRRMLIFWWNWIVWFRIVITGDKPWFFSTSPSPDYVESDTNWGQMAGTLTRFWSRSEGRCWCYEMLNHVSVCLRVLSTRSMRLLLCKNMKPVCKWTITQRLHNGLCNEATRIICFSMAGLLPAYCLLSKTSSSHGFGFGWGESGLLWASKNWLDSMESPQASVTCSSPQTCRCLNALLCADWMASCFEIFNCFVYSCMDVKTLEANKCKKKLGELYYISVL